MAPARLGRVAPALLGHADPDHPLRRLRPGRRCRATSCRWSCPRMSASTSPAIRSTAIRPGSKVDCPQVRRRRRGARPTRSTPSSIRAGISSASPASRTTSRSTAPRPSSGCRSANISAGSSMRSCTCSTPASGPARSSGSARLAITEPFKGLFTQGMVTHETYRSRRRPLAQPRRGRGRRGRRAGSSARPARAVTPRPRREDVQVEEEHGRPRADRRPLRRRRGALVHAVRQPARARPRMVGRRDRGRGALRPARLAAGAGAGRRRGRGRGARRASSTGPSPRSARRSRGCSSTRRSPQLYELTSAIEKAAPSASRDEAIRTLAPARRADGAAPCRRSLGGAAARRAWSPTPPGRRSTRRCWSTTR